MSKHTVSPARFGMTWIRGEGDEVGNEWIEIGVLDDEGHVEKEIAVLMLRNAKETERKFPGIRQKRERHAKTIVDALNECFEDHGLAEGFLWAG